MLTITQSHDPEVLFEALADALGTPVADPLQPLTVLTPTRALGRWIEWRWAQRFGVAAHFEILFPASFLWRCYSALPEGGAGVESLPREVMQWRVFEALADLPEDEEAFAPLRQYLARTPQPVAGRWQLAGRIAQAFADYISYRPDWLERWQRGERLGRPWRHEEWQARLWCDLFAMSFERGKGLFEQYFAALARQPDLRAALPERLAVFTTVRLPPPVLQFYQALAGHVDLHWLHLNPSREYWADVVDPRWRARMERQAPEKMRFTTVGHPLLAAWGKQARDNFRLLSELAGGELDNDWRDRFPEVNQETLLGRLQASILSLEHQDETQPLPEWPLADGDDSIRIHSGHSLTRQLEVLHDSLLDLFARRPDLRPHEVAVMLPDCAGAAGAIEAVFAAQPEARRIPWRITGVPDAEENTLWRAFEGFYRLTQTRLAQSALLDWLALPPVADYYGLAADEIEPCAALLQAAGVYRGLDGEHRARLSGDPDDTDDTHTLRFGLERLLLAVALPPEFDGLVAGIQPVAGVEAGRFALIGVLLRAVNDLAQRRDDWNTARPVADWLDRLDRDRRQFLGHLTGEHSLRRLERALDSLRDEAARARASEPVPLSLLMRELAARMENTVPEPLPGGAVTFCRIGALRGMPFRVVALLGLEDTAFPRRDPFNEFDLMRLDEHPRPGDRSRRDDDRGAFLDALMSARDHLWLGYSGHSNNQSAEFPPSLLITELLDYLATRVPGGSAAVRRSLLTEHRLQAFSPAYFRDDAPVPRSHAADWIPAARAVLRATPTEPPFIDAALPEPVSPLTLTLDGLNGFFRHPAKHYLTRCLGLRLEDNADQLQDEEPLRLDGLEKWQLRQRLFSGGELPESALRAAGALPPGVVGAVYHEQASAQLQELLAVWRARRPVTAERRTVLLDSDRLLAELPPGAEPWQMTAVVSKRSAKYLLRVWLAHLAWQASGAGGPSFGLFLDGPVEFAPMSPETALAELRAWRDAWRAGQVRPLVLPPDTALTYVEKAQKDEDKANGWLAGEWSKLADDSYWRQALSADERERPLAGFAALAQRLMGPLHAGYGALSWDDLRARMAGADA